jgi:hypothetical protein
MNGIERTVQIRSVGVLLRSTIGEHPVQKSGK